MSRMVKILAVLATSLLTLVALFWPRSGLAFEPTMVRGQRVLITGATSVIGEAIAHQYAKLGASLVLTALKEDTISDVVSTCSRLGAAQAHGVSANLFYRKSRQEVVDAAQELLGGIDILVLAHGRFGGAGWWIGDGDNMTTLFEDLNLNFFGYADLVSRALPLLETSGGGIAFVSSVGSYISLPWRSTAAASQFATRGFFQALRLELQRYHSPVTVSECYLGILEPEGRGASARVVAMAVVEAVSMRQRETFFPRFGALAAFLNAAFPGLVESRIQNFVAN